MVALITGLIPIVNFLIEKFSKNAKTADETKRRFIKAVVEGLHQSAKSVALKQSYEAQGQSFEKEIQAQKTDAEKQKLAEYIKAAEAQRDSKKT